MDTDDEPGQPLRFQRLREGGDTSLDRWRSRIDYHAQKPSSSSHSWADALRDASDEEIAARVRQMIGDIDGPAMPKPAGGAPPKARQWTAERIREWYAEASAEYADDGTQVTMRDLADAVGARSLNTARRVLREAGLRWSDLTQDAD